MLAALTLLSGDSSPRMYCSMMSAPIGTPNAAPNPPFSTYTATAICGLFLGAKPMKAEWS